MDKKQSKGIDRRWILLPVALFALVFQTSAANAAAAAIPSFTQVVVLGDSLSDNGNLYAATGFPLAPYWQGRASNGPVEVELLAQKFAVPLIDFAWMGATTGVGNIVDGGTMDTLGLYGFPGMATELQSALSANTFPIDPNALYVVWGGANDLRSATSPAAAAVIIGKAAANLRNIVVRLQSLGATQILVLNMPDLGKTPLARAMGPQVSFFLRQVSLMFNQVLRSSLPPGVHYFDTFTLFDDIAVDPEKYGFLNVTDQLMLAPGADPASYFFWDGAHPTAAGHAIIAEALYRSTAPTVIVGEIDSGVPNALLDSGSTISDLIALAALGARNHGQFVSTVTSITNDLVRGGVISGSEKGAIESCAAWQ